MNCGEEENLIWANEISKRSLIYRISLQLDTSFNKIIIIRESERERERGIECERDRERERKRDMLTRSESEDFNS